jgi:hypothetical protein
MHDPIEIIRIALTPDATPEARAAGAVACRAILAALDSTTAPSAGAPTLNAEAIASVVAALRGVAPEQLLDLAITKLRSALPAGAQVSPVRPIKFHLVPLSKGV